MFQLCASAALISTRASARSSSTTSSLLGLQSRAESIHWYRGHWDPHGDPPADGTPQQACYKMQRRGEASGHHWLSLWDPHGHRSAGSPQPMRDRYMRPNAVVSSHAHLDTQDRHHPPRWLDEPLPDHHLRMPPSAVLPEPASSSFSELQLAPSCCTTSAAYPSLSTPEARVDPMRRLARSLDCPTAASMDRSACLLGA